MHRTFLSRSGILILLCGCLAVSTIWAEPQDGQEQLKVGVQADGRILVPTNQMIKPAGTQITFPGRPVDLALTADGQTLVVKNMRNLVFIDVATARIKQTLT